MKYTITSLSQKLIVSLDIEEGLYNERILEFDQPSVVLQNDIVEILESGESLISIPFHHFGLIDGEVPTDIEDAFYKLQEFINTLDVAGLVGIDTSFYISTYSPTKTVAYDATKPNFEIHLTGNLDLTITGTANGDSGLVNLYFSANEIAKINGYKPLVLIGSSEMIPIYFSHDSDGLKWSEVIPASSIALKEHTVLFYSIESNYTQSMTNVGNVCTVPYVDAQKIGFKVVKPNGESAIIESVNSFTEFTTDVPFATNSTATFTSYSPSLKVFDTGAFTIFDKNGEKIISNNADGTLNLGARITQNAIGNIDVNGVWSFGEALIEAANSSLTFPHYANLNFKYGPTIDVKLNRYDVGVLQVLNSTDTLADIKIKRTLQDPLNVYANDAAADADSTLPSGAYYKLTGSRVVYQK